LKDLKEELSKVRLSSYFGEIIGDLMSWWLIVGGVSTYWGC
jgi:hypothetical protein